MWQENARSQASWQGKRARAFDCGQRRIAVGRGEAVVSLGVLRSIWLSGGAEFGSAAHT